MIVIKIGQQYCIELLKSVLKSVTILYAYIDL